MFCDRNEKDDGREYQRREAEFGSRRECSRKANPTPLRNEAQLNCVSIRSELKYEVSWGIVKGQDERPLRGALDSFPTHFRRFMQLGKEIIRMAATSALTFYDLLIDSY